MISTVSFDVLMSLSMFAFIVLVWGGIVLLRRGNDRKRAILMLTAAVVLLGNILVWTWPA